MALTPAAHLGGLALREGSRGPGAAPPPPAGSPARLAARSPAGPGGSIPELRLLAARVGGPPTLSRGCAALSGPLSGPAPRPVQRCLGRALPAPLDQALITEEIANRRVHAAAAEEAHPDPAAAARRQRALLLALSRVLVAAPAVPADSAPAAAPPRHSFQLGLCHVNLDREAQRGALISLEIRCPPETVPSGPYSPAALRGR